MKNIVFLLGATLMQSALAADGDIQAFVEKNRQQMAEQGWTINSDGTASNSKTGLTWKRCLEGQTLEGNTCSGEPKQYKWHEATQLKSNFAGQSDWRMPSVDELHAIVYCSNGRQPIQRDKAGETATINGVDANGACLGKSYQTPTANLAVFPTYKMYGLWSASPNAAYTGYAWVVGFGTGYAYWGNKDDGDSVRLVRGQ